VTVNLSLLPDLGGDFRRAGAVGETAQYLTDLDAANRRRADHGHHMDSAGGMTRCSLHSMRPRRPPYHKRCEAGGMTLVKSVGVASGPFGPFFLRMACALSAYESGRRRRTSRKRGVAGVAGVVPRRAESGDKTMFERSGRPHSTRSDAARLRWRSRAAAGPPTFGRKRVAMH